MKAIGYVRVSTEEQKKEGVSIEAQAAKIAKYAAFKEIPPPVEIVKDENVSGSRPLNLRAGGEQVLALADSGEVTDIIVTKLDRLFRNLKDCVSILDDFEEKVAVHLVDEGGAIDTSTPDGWLQVMIKAVFAEYEARTIRFRTKAALDYKKASGQVYNHIPYGYREENGRLVKEEKEQSVIGLMKQWRFEGATFKRIADRLNKDKVPTKGYGKGKKFKQGKWHAETIRQILKNAEAGR